MSARKNARQLLLSVLARREYIQHRERESPGHLFTVGETLFSLSLLENHAIYSDIHSIYSRPRMLVNRDSEKLRLIVSGRRGLQLSFISSTEKDSLIHHRQVKDCLLLVYGCYVRLFFLATTLLVLS